MTDDRTPAASDLLAVRRMLPIQAERFLTGKGYNGDEIERLRGTFGSKIEPVRYEVHDNLRALFMSVMYYKGVPYRQLGMLYQISHSTAWNQVKRLDPSLKPVTRLKITMEELQAYQRAFYEHAQELIPLDIPVLAERLDQIAVDYIDK